MICWGMRDIAFSHRDLERWTSLFDNAQVHRYEHVGHLPPEEVAADLSDALDAFAREVERG
jgi:pimeloyl-ACP methyl ester carboxylesterase